MLVGWASLGRIALGRSGYGTVRIRQDFPVCASKWAYSWRDKTKEIAMKVRAWESRDNGVVGFTMEKTISLPIPPAEGMMVVDDVNGAWSFEIKTVWVWGKRVEVQVEHQAEGDTEDTRKLLRKLGWKITLD